MQRLGKEVIIFDGGLGSELEKLGLGGVPEELNVTNPAEIRAIHRSYSCADCIMTNTFGLNRIKYKGKYSIKLLAEKAVENARAAGKKVFFDIGPTGAMTEPLGTLSFDEAYEAFAEVVDCTRDIVDGYIAETFSDLYEIKACVLAIKEHSDKPVFATMTFDGTGRTLTGSTPEIVANTLAGLGVDALGVNCSLGPREMQDVVKRLLACSSVPVIVQPNRGVPVLENGRTRYTLGVKEFAGYIEKFIAMGVSAVGGCCGTTPEFIKAISRFGGAKVNRLGIAAATVVNSATKAVQIDGVKICGERLNPTGRKRLKEALLAGDYDYLADEAVAQQEAGADILDLNAGLPQLDEAAAFKKAVLKIQEYADTPLQLDSSDVRAIEAGARYYNGVPLINSVNGDAEVMDGIFPVAKKYGAVVLGLTMDKNGVPSTAEARLEIARRIIERAESYGIPRHKIMIDALVLTASAEQPLVNETLKAIKLISGLGVKTALGISNVSFGLPNRGLLNRTFLAAAMACGLNMPIMNPLDTEMTDAVRAFAVLSGEDENSESYIGRYGNYSAPDPVAEKQDGLYACIKKGAKQRAAELCRAELGRTAPMTVVNEILIKALEEVGRDYESGRLYLPQLVSAAEAAKRAFAVVGERLVKGGTGKGKIALATVRGDVHDIGKNIVKVVLESYGYEVVDLGKDTPVESVVEACRKHNPKALGLSALMTTTVKAMSETIAAVRAAGFGLPVFVGGAVLNAETAAQIGADYYTRDALELVKTLEKIR